jgi:hypothetical protein
MKEDFALKVILNAINSANKKGVIKLKDSLQFRIAITVIMNSEKKNQYIKQIQQGTKNEN